MTLPSSRKRDKALGRKAVNCTLKIFSPSSKDKKVTVDMYHLAGDSVSPSVALRCGYMNKFSSTECEQT